jgi:plastocyanin
MHMRSRRITALLAAGALASFGLAACGGSDSSSTSSTTTAAADDDDAAVATSSSTTAATGSGSTVKVAADPSGALAFTNTKLTTKSGNDTIEFDNQSSTPHNVEIESSDGQEVASTDTITGGKTSTTADLKPGTYTFFCDVPGHREAGMQGTLTVK